MEEGENMIKCTVEGQESTLKNQTKAKIIVNLKTIKIW